MNYRHFSFLFGFSVWFIATLIVRFWGHFFFDQSSIPVISTVFLGMIPILYTLLRSFFSYFSITSEQKLKSTIWIVSSGMFLDVFCIQFHSTVFPTLSIEQSITMSSWILWAFLLVLILGFIIQVKDIPATR